MSKTLAYEDFIPYQDTVFRVKSARYGSTDMTLVKIENRTGRAVQGFSLMFKGPLDRPLTQKSRQVIHPEMGEFDLFIVPVHTGKTDGIYYQAVFSRL
jgi:hypothetical protein